MKDGFNTKCMWVQQYPEFNDVAEYAKELIATEYACFKTKCGEIFLRLS